MTRSWRLPSAIAVTLVIASAGCAGGGDIEALPGAAPAVSGLPLPQVDVAFTTGLATSFCVPGGTGPVRVTPHLPTEGFALSEFRIIDYEPPNLFGDARAPLSSRFASFQDRRIRPCSEGRSEVALELRRTGSGPQTASGFEVSWDAPEPGGLFIPVGMVLCDGPASLPRCDRPGVLRQVQARLDELS